MSNFRMVRIERNLTELYSPVDYCSKWKLIKYFLTSGSKHYWDLCFTLVLRTWNIRYMKLLLLGLFTILSMSAGAGQLAFDPASIDIFGNPTEELITVTSDLSNSGDEDVTFYWKLEKNDDFPSLWETQICDFNLCYPENIDESNPDLPNVIKAGETRNIKVYLLPHGMEGESSLELTLYSDKEFNESIVSLPSSSMMVSNSTSVFNQKDKDVVLYPNPTTDYFKVSDDQKIKNIAVYNIVGKELLRFRHIPGQSHNVENLRKGIYLVRFFDGKGEVIKALRLSKQ